MKTIQLFFILLLTVSCHNQNIFEIETIETDKNIIDELSSLKDIHHTALLYKDKIYDVWYSCSGEWGGTVYFKNKKSGKIHYTTATCPVSVNKIDGTYYVSASMSHGFGNSYVLEIKNPEIMEETTKIHPYNPGIITREYEAHTSKGVRKLADSSGVLIMSSFVYNKKLYSILANNGKTKTTISELNKNKFHTVQKIDPDLFSYDPIINKESETHQRIYIQHPKPAMLDIRNNKIKVVLFKKSNK
ncbi:hypothetical protein [Chryseobacterium sp.]|uniref:hypothetical protein n=1 Tax=Chryseobacterium sp. TaxID=1871047 RepID=UPI00262C668E|nr:hypothetical protein [Chryseobacterium sp.]